MGNRNILQNLENRPSNDDKRKDILSHEWYNQFENSLNKHQEIDYDNCNRARTKYKPRS